MSSSNRQAAAPVKLSRVEDGMQSPPPHAVNKRPRTIIAGDQARKRNQNPTGDECRASWKLHAREPFNALPIAQQAAGRMCVACREV